MIAGLGRGTKLAGLAGVPSLMHEFLVDLFRQRPPLAVELLQAGLGIRLEGATVEVGSIDLSQVAPTAYRSDALTGAPRSDAEGDRGGDRRDPAV